MATHLVDTRIVMDAMQLACRAPSPHNGRPWRLVADKGCVQLFADAPGREALLSCGALLDHFRVAMAAAGYTANVDRFPNPANGLHIATITFTPMEVVTDRDRQRANSILLRGPDRFPLGAPPAWDAFESRLRETVDASCVRVDTIPAHLFAEACQLNESLRLCDYSHESELNWWTAAFTVLTEIPQHSRTPADRSRVVALSTYGDSREAVVRCGEQLSAVLLDATTAGLATCMLTRITEMASSRAIVAGLIDQSDQSIMPQVLIRVGLAPSIEEEPDLWSIVGANGGATIL